MLPRSDQPFPVCEKCRSPNITIQKVGEIHSVPQIRVTCHNPSCRHVGNSHLYGTRQEGEFPDQQGFLGTGGQAYEDAQVPSRFKCLLRIVVLLLIGFGWFGIFVPGLYDSFPFYWVTGSFLYLLIVILWLPQCFRRTHFRRAMRSRKFGWAELLIMILSVMTFIWSVSWYSDSSDISGLALAAISFLAFFSPFSNRRIFKVSKFLYWAAILLLIVYYFIT